MKYTHSKDNIMDDGDVSGIIIKNGHIGFSIEIDPCYKKFDEMRREAEDAENCHDCDGYYDCA